MYCNKEERTNLHNAHVNELYTLSRQLRTGVLTSEDVHDEHLGETAEQGHIGFYGSDFDLPITLEYKNRYCRNQSQHRQI